MKVQEVIIDTIEGELTRYMLVDGGGNPVITVTKYLKYLDNLGRKESTLRSYCHHLKLYYEYLSVYQLSYDSICIDDLAQFIGWLRRKNTSKNVTPIKKEKSSRSERTINTILSCVLSFYAYLDKVNIYGNNIIDSSKEQVPSRYKNYKPFLHHISQNNSIDKNILKVKEPKRKIRTLTQQQVQLIHDNCTNIRDELLIKILYEGGLRIGEAISLEVNNFNIVNNSIEIKKSKTPAGERVVFVSTDTMNIFQDYLIEFHAYEVDSNYVFVKLAGKFKGEPLSRNTVESIVRRIRKKTGIDFTPHMLRHTFASELHAQGVEVATLQKLLGHQQVQTTINTYVHISDEQLRESYTKATDSKNKIR